MCRKEETSFYVICYSVILPPNAIFHAICSELRFKIVMKYLNCLYNVLFDVLMHSFKFVFFDGHINKQQLIKFNSLTLNFDVYMKLMHFDVHFYFEYFIDNTFIMSFSIYFLLTCRSDYHRICFAFIMIRISRKMCF
jgi:hypothetical protein